MSAKPYCLLVVWVVEIADEFEPEFDALHEEVQTEILAPSPGAVARPALAWRTVNGEWPLPSILRVRQSCSLPAINQVSVRSASIAI
jgi:hypothetical protein